MQRHDRAGIVEIVRALVRLRPALGPQWKAIAQIASENGEIGCARSAMEEYVAEAGQSAQARYEQAGLLAHMGDWAAAHAILADLPEDRLDPAALAHSRGTAAMYLGEADQARQMLERAVELRPQTGMTWLSLATLIDFAREPHLASRILGAAGGLATAPGSERANFLYALGKAHADLGDHCSAFTAFAEAAQLMRQSVRYDRKRARFMANDAIAGSDADRLAALAALQTEPTARTIFVTGLPRSGTTLVEQILASHSEVGGGGEINRLALLMREIRGLSPAALEAHMAKVGAPELARLWHHWIDDRFPGGGRVVDKTNNTGPMLGLAAAVLPEAPLIWVTRDPLDCAWSCFRTAFQAAQPWSCDLADIAHHFRLEDELRAHWCDVLGERLLVVPYEELVRNPAPWTRRILAHCGLAEEPQVFTPHTTARAVTTSSVMQVRQPISTKAIGAAAPYREWLGPFLAAYQG